jgi:putative endonuclease
MPKVFTSKTQKTGEIGEHVAVRYLKSKGFTILERNYTRKWGEIDIVAQKGDFLHFVEVKSQTISHFVKGSGDTYRPEDNMHPWKIQRLQRTVASYLAENDVQGEWQFDLLVVHFSSDLLEAKITFLENVVL